MAERDRQSRVDGEDGEIEKVPPEELGRSAQSRPSDEEAEPNDKVEEASVDSFPASDPPAY